MNAFARLRAGATDAEAIRADLLAFHEANPGVTDAALVGARTGSGMDSFEVLADQLEPDHTVVADLGAGAGTLVRTLLRRPGLRRIVAVEASTAERARLPGDPRVEPAVGLPEGLDAVLSHHAFYRLRPIEPVVAELARVIRPGGIFAWTTTSARTGQHPHYVELLTLLRERVQAAVPTFPGWGDSRQWLPAGRARLFAGPEWEPLVEKDFVLLLREPPERILERLMAFNLGAWLVDRAELAAAWRAVLPVGADGMVEFEWPWAVVIARRSGGDES